MKGISELFLFLIYLWLVPNVRPDLIRLFICWFASLRGDVILPLFSFDHKIWMKSFSHQQNQKVLIAIGKTKKKYFLEIMIITVKYFQAVTKLSFVKNKVKFKVASHEI